MTPTLIRTFIALAATAGLLSLCGCPPCERLCEAEAEVYSLCLGEWEMTWTNVGYAGVEEYEYVCKDDVSIETGRLDDDERRARNGDCAARNSDLRSTDDCDELYDLLEGFGVE